MVLYTYCINLIEFKNIPKRQWILFQSPKLDFKSGDLITLPRDLIEKTFPSELNNLYKNTSLKKEDPHLFKVVHVVWTGLKNDEKKTQPVAYIEATLVTIL